MAKKENPNQYNKTTLKKSKAGRALEFDPH